MLDMHVYRNVSVYLEYNTIYDFFKYYIAIQITNS